MNISETTLQIRISEKRLAAAHGSYNNLLNIVKKRKMMWYGHVTRSSGLAKPILQGTISRRKWKDWLKKRLKNNIWQWTGLFFTKSQNTAPNRSRWWVIIRESLGLPLQSLSPTVMRLMMGMIYLTSLVWIQWFPSHRLVAIQSLKSSDFPSIYP